ncbi:heat shock 70 kDa protein 12B [Numida meleagris]|uniref:heat shock 70 kDa protein 12B n=1 Tax=Numida meleagris TaxID=8996 RepID=UPI000B3D865A|nr:heat shock 70 kDa protein 12B [Numida meleagris]
MEVHGDGGARGPPSGQSPRSPLTPTPLPGGPYGAVGVDVAFEQLLCRIFGEDFISSFKAKRPAAWVDLSIAFEARKRAAAPWRCTPVNISLPFSFIDFYRKHRGHSVETALRRSNVNLVKWSSQGMLRMSAEAMSELFQPTITRIIQHIGTGGRGGLTLPVPPGAASGHPSLPGTPRGGEPHVGTPPTRTATASGAHVAPRFPRHRVGLRLGTMSIHGP